MCQCGGNNSLTKCSCQDNCPDVTSELTFDGVLNNINVPPGSSLNDVLALLEAYVNNTVNNLNLTFVVPASNCIGLTAGTYGYNQVLTAILSTICTLNTAVANNHFKYVKEYSTAGDGDDITIPYTEITGCKDLPSACLATGTTDNPKVDYHVQVWRLNSEVNRWERVWDSDSVGRIQYHIDPATGDLTVVFAFAPLSVAMLHRVVIIG